MIVELLAGGVVLGSKEKKIDLGELDKDALKEDAGEDSGSPFGEVVETDGEEEEEIPPFLSGDEDSDDSEEPPFLEDSSASPEEFTAGSQEGLSELEEKVTGVSSAVEKVESSLKNLDERISTMEKNMQGVTSLYELATKEMNPFIETSPMSESPPESEGNDGVEEPGGVEDEEEGGFTGFKAHETQGLEAVYQEQDKDMGRLKPGEDEVKLTRIKNDPNSLLLLFNWLDFLIKKAGYHGMIKTLLFYEEVGWITREVRDQMMRYSHHLSGKKATRGKPTLTTLDHIASLFFIAKLQGIEISPALYSQAITKLEELDLI